MTTHVERRPQRADARRNHERIVAAARSAFSERGPLVSLDEIAKRADVSPATLYRHFANRNELVAAVVERRFADEVEPAIAAALAGDDPWRGLVDVIGATVRVGTTSEAWRETVLMAKEAGLMADVVRERFEGPVGELLARAQAAGVVRTDVGIADLPPIIRMLRALVTTGGDLTDGAWLRYLWLMLRRDAPGDGPAPTAG